MKQDLIRKFVEKLDNSYNYKTVNERQNIINDLCEIVEIEQLTIPAAMPRCSTCKHWKQNTFYNYEGAENDGFCSELSSELAIELKTGWDGGYVVSIETKSTFGCVLHNGA